MCPERIKKLCLLPVLMALVLASGCISVEVEQKIHSDGWSDIKTTFDMSAMYTAAQGMMPDTPGQISDISESLSEYCTNFFQSTTLSDPYCTPVPSEYKAISGGKIYIGDDPSFTVTKTPVSTVYRYDAMGIENFISESTEAQGQEITPEQAAQAKAMADLMGLSFKYKIEMPGTITKADTGEVNGNVVEMDMFELYGMQHVYIESEEAGAPILDLCVMIGIAVIAILLVILIYTRMKKNKRKGRRL